MLVNTSFYQNDKKQVFHLKEPENLNKTNLSSSTKVSNDNVNDREEQYMLLYHDYITISFTSTVYSMIVKVSHFTSSNRKEALVNLLRITKLLMLNPTEICLLSMFIKKIKSLDDLSFESLLSIGLISKQQTGGEVYSIVFSHVISLYNNIEDLIINFTKSKFTFSLIDVFTEFQILTKPMQLQSKEKEEANSELLLNVEAKVDKIIKLSNPHSKTLISELENREQKSLELKLKVKEKKILDKTNVNPFLPLNSLNPIVDKGQLLLKEKKDKHINEVDEDSFSVCNVFFPQCEIVSQNKKSSGLLNNKRKKFNH